MKKRILIIVAVLILVALGVRAIKHKKASEAKTPVAKRYEVVVKGFTPKLKDTILTLPYLAIAQNEKDVTLSSKIPGRIIMIKKEGTKVKKGELIAKVDTTDLEATISSLKLSLSNLLQTHKRTKELYKVGGASIEQLQKEESEISSLKAKLKAAQNNLSYAKILSPTNGIVAKTFLNEGSTTMPGKPIISVSANSGYSLLVRTPSSLNPKGIILDNKAYKLFPLNSTFNGLFEYKAYIDRSLTSGERKEVSVIVFNKKAIKLPFDTILDKDGKSYVLVIKKHKAIPKEVHIVQSGEEGVVVEEDLEGEKLVLAKPDIMLKLLSGASLKVQEK